MGIESKVKSELVAAKKAISIVKPKYLTFLREVIQNRKKRCYSVPGWIEDINFKKYSALKRNSIQRRHKPDFMMNLAEELNRDYFFDFLENDGVYGSESTGLIFRIGDSDSSAKDLFLRFFGEFYSLPSAPPTEKDIHKKFETLKNRALGSVERCARKIENIDDASNLSASQFKRIVKYVSDVSDIFQTAADSVFTRKTERINHVIRNDIYPDFSIIDSCKKAYLADVNLVDKFIRNFRLAAEFFSNDEKADWNYYVDYIGKLLKINSDFALNIFDKLTPIYVQKGKKFLDEILAFSSDAMEICPSFFDLNMFNEYVYRMNPQSVYHDFTPHTPQSKKLKDIKSLVLAYRNDKTEIRQAIVDQIKKQYSSDSNKNIIKLNIPDKMYTLKSQVEAFRQVYEDPNYLKQKPSNEDKYISEKILPELAKMMSASGTLEIRALGCGTGVSELRFVRNLEKHLPKHRLHLCLCDINERMIDEARVNAYDDVLENGFDMTFSGKRCDFLDRKSIKFISSEQFDRSVYLILGGTVGNFSSKARQRIFGNIYKNMQSGDVLIVTCGTKPDLSSYCGESTARFIFSPLRMLGIEEKSIFEFDGGLSNYSCKLQGKKIIGAVTLNDDTKIEGLDHELKEGTEFQVLYSDRIDPESFKKELSLFELHGGAPFITPGNRAIAVCYKK